MHGLALLYNVHPARIGAIRMRLCLQKYLWLRLHAELSFLVMPLLTTWSSGNPAAGPCNDSPWSLRKLHPVPRLRSVCLTICYTVIVNLFHLKWLRNSLCVGLHRRRRTVPVGVGSSTHAQAEQLAWHCVCTYEHTCVCRKIWTRGRKMHFYTMKSCSKFSIFTEMVIKKRERQRTHIFNMYFTVINTYYIVWH